MELIKKIIFALLLLFSAVFCQAADTIFFKPINLKTLLEPILVEGFTTQTTQYHEGLYFITGSENNSYGLSFKILDKNNITLYSSASFSDAMYLELYFYEVNGEIILLAENGFEYGTGGQAFLIQDNNVNLLGNIDFAIPLEKDIARINKHLKVYKHDNSYCFDPKNIDVVIVSPGTDKEIEKYANEVSFKFNLTDSK